MSHLHTESHKDAAAQVMWCKRVIECMCPDIIVPTYMLWDNWSMTVWKCICRNLLCMLCCAFNKYMRFIEFVVLFSSTELIAVTWASVVYPSTVCNSVFSETINRINTNFCGKVATHHISRPLFPFLKILNFKRFLALLDCVSRAIAVARASVVRKMHFLRNRQAN